MAAHASAPGQEAGDRDADPLVLPRPPEDPYASDPLLAATLRRVLPDDVRADVEEDLGRLSARCGATGDLEPWADDAEARPPRLVRYDPAGRRVDRVELAEGWAALKRAGAKEGLLADAYARPHGPLSRVVQAAKVHLFNPVSAVATCPLAMADGAARILEVQRADVGQPNPDGAADLLEEAFERLTSADPARAWTSGQWMTERAGGSDVSRTGTVARWDGDAGAGLGTGQGTGAWRLSGRKWFCSAIDAEVAFTLARVADPGTGETVPGTEGLGLFFLPVRRTDADADDAGGPRADADGPASGARHAPAPLRPGIRVERLKDKLGTRALPTAEVVLDGAEAILLGEAGEGVRRISTLLNITRTWNALCSASQMRRALDLAEDHARRRRAFGRPLADLPLHVETLAGLEVRAAAAFHLAFRCAELVGLTETGEATERQAQVLRLLTPVTKLYTAKEVIAACSEALECFGGAGYVEDTGLPRLLRDAQVLSIWEGTTNVLALDAVRALSRDEAGPAFLAATADRIETADRGEVEEAAMRVDAALLRLKEQLASLPDRDPADVEAGARRLAYGLARTFASGLMVEHAQWALDAGDPDAPRAVEAADRFTEGQAGPLVEGLGTGKAHRAGSRRLALGDEG